jgi:Mlc titration factor MtfA (ptsG expression regulator)
MWSLHAWRRRRLLSRYPVSDSCWAAVRRRLPILDGLSAEQDCRLRERAVLFLQRKRLSILHGLSLDEVDRLSLAALAELPLLELAELNWYRGFHELIVYPDDFISPQRHRDANGIEHEWDAEHSGEAWQYGPLILAWSGVQASGHWDGYNLVVHELAHKLDMLGGAANGLPPLHRNMRVKDWASAMQQAFDGLNHRLERDPEAQTGLDPYAAESPAEFFAVASEYFFNAPDVLTECFPAVYQQLSLFYRQDPLVRWRRVQLETPDFQTSAAYQEDKQERRNGNTPGIHL